MLRPLTLSFALATGLTSLAAAQQMAPPQRPRHVGPEVDDCNSNGVADLIDIGLGTSTDCNLNLVPDECDIGERTLLLESFELGLPAGWLTGGIAHVTDQCARPSQCDGPNFLYFGLDALCTFDEPGTPTGFVSLPPLELPAAADEIWLTYCSAYEGEGAEPYDSADVFIDGKLRDHVSPTPQLDWESRAINLSAMAGQTIEIDFEFNAMDHIGNMFLGWQIDNVHVFARGVGEPSIDCNINGILDVCEPDCNANGVPDDCDVAFATSPDCNVNGIPDECDLAATTSVDCNSNLIPDECDLGLDLHGALVNLETAHPIITSYFPDTHAFPGGDDGNCIEFDSLGTFDCASTLNTDLATQMPYTGSSATAGSGFGPGAAYFTAKYDGLFTMVATRCGVDTFSIGGDNGIGLTNAIVDALELSINVDGEPYTLYVKRVHGAGNASSNQVIAIPGDGTGVTHSFPADPRDSGQTLDGLADIDRIFYFLVSRRIPGEPGPPLRPIDAQEMMRELIENTPGPTSTDDDGNGVPDECD